MTNRPCYIQVTRVHCRRDGEHREPTFVTERDRTPTRYRSLRHARRRILDAADCMDYLSRVLTYEIALVPLDGGPAKRVADGVVDAVEAWNRWQSYEHSIGARLRRGETVAV